MEKDQFPTHFDGQPVNPEGMAPSALPLEITYGKARYRIDADAVHITNSTEDNEEVTWTEPLSSYDTVRHWVIAEGIESPTGFFPRLFGRTSAPKESGARHSVIALAHARDPWMSVILHSRQLSADETPEGVDRLIEAYHGILALDS